MTPKTFSRRTLLQMGTAAAAAAAVPARAMPVGPGAAQVADAKARAPRELRTRGVFAHAWDLRDEGVDAVLGWARDSGLNQVHIAGTYHSGWFVHPRKQQRRLYMPEGAVVYFPPDPSIFKSTPIVPEVASFVRETNWLARAGERLDRYGLRLISWTVGAHTTRLAQRYPEYAQHTAYGDPLPHALSIGHDAVRQYLKAVCRDLATNYPMYGVQLEAFGWLGVRHGHHHERDLVGLTAVEQALLSICFNPETMRKARAREVDADKARATARTVLDAAFREAPDRPAGHPESLAELEARAPELQAYNRVRRELADDLIVEIKQEALDGTSCKLLMQGPYQPAIAPAVDGFSAAAYGQAPAQVLETVRRGAAALPEGWTGDFPCFIRLGEGVPGTAGELRDIVSALHEGGSTGPVFYNYSESPPRMLSWVRDAMKAR